MAIKIWFTDFWEHFNVYDNYFTKILSKHFDIEITSDHPDFLIYSWGARDYFNFKNCVRIFYTGENIRPDFTVCDYSISFDYDSYDGRNLRLPLYVMYGDVNQLLLEKDPEKLLNNKSKFCNFIYSNNRAIERNKIFELLSKYKKIDSGGKVLNNIGYLVENKLDFIKDYKFTIAFENSSYPGYTTEKIFEPMLVDSLPIYWGNQNVKTDFNTKSFINVHEYDNLEDVVERIIEIDTNDGLYLDYMMQPYFENNKTNKFAREENITAFFENIFSEKKVIRTYSLLPKDIKVSVIIPVYNTENYLKECLDSVLNQDFQDYEIICVNDGSTDNSLQILSNFQKEHQKIVIIDQDNQGLSTSRNNGIKTAKGKYIVFLDSDDMLLADMLKETYLHAEKYELDVLGFNGKNESLHLIPDSYSGPTEIVNGQSYFFHYFSLNNNFPPSNSYLYMYNKRFLYSNNLWFQNNIVHEDEPFFMTMLYFVRKMMLLNRTFYYRRIRDGSITQSIYLKNSKDLVFICNNLYYFFKFKQCVEPLFYRKIFQLYLTAILHSIEGGFASKRKEFIANDDFKIMKNCVYNFTSFYNYFLIKKSFRLFEMMAINKRPLLISKFVSLICKGYYFIVTTNIIKSRWKIY